MLFVNNYKMNKRAILFGGKYLSFPETGSFMKDILETLQNHTINTLDIPEIFGCPSPPNPTKFKAMAIMQLMNEPVPFDLEYIERALDSIENGDEVRMEILSQCLAKPLNNSAVLDALSFFFPSKKFITLLTKLPGHPFIPDLATKGKTNLKFGAKGTTGRLLEELSSFGALFRDPFLPNLGSPVQMITKLKEPPAPTLKLIERYKSIKYQKDAELFFKEVSEKSTTSAKQIVDLVKKIMVNPETKQEGFRFFWAVVNGNADRAKLSSLVSSSESKTSSESFSIAVIDVLAEMTMPILENQNHLSKVSAEFLRNSKYFREMQQTPIFIPEKKEEGKEMEIELSSAVQTTSEYFFLMAETLRVLFIPFMESIDDLNNLIRRIDQELNKFPKNHPNCSSKTPSSQSSTVF